MSKTISDLRDVLFSTIEGLKDGSVDIDRARAINELSKTITDTAKVEIDYLRVVGGGESTFIDGAIGADNLPSGITGRQVHRLK
jgi:hypothetical protein